jgi:hypothetical protein
VWARNVECKEKQGPKSGGSNTRIHAAPEGRVREVELGGGVVVQKRRWGALEELRRWSS